MKNYSLQNRDDGYKMVDPHEKRKDQDEIDRGKEESKNKEKQKPQQKR